MRNHYHASDMNKWLGRFKNTVAPDYLYKPEHKIKFLDLKRIFMNFDSDGSNTLEIEQFFEMFKEAYLNSLLEGLSESIKQEIKSNLFQGIHKRLTVFFGFVSNNNKLTLEQFIQLAFHDEARQYFLEMIKYVN